jgi:heptose I phosphotransferase
LNDSYISTELSKNFSEDELFAQVDRLQGEVFRQVANRRTIRTNIGTDDYFAKIHFGVGWIEILKNLLQGRLPVLGAGNEWRALQRLASVGVPSMTPVLYCESGSNPATRKSAILTKALKNKITLEDFETDDPILKRQLIDNVAVISRTMHESGVNHRDYYLCHFLMDEPIVAGPVLHLIDLHRAQIRARVPFRWLVKDLGGLLFSAFDKHLTKRDLLRFIRNYRKGSLRESLKTDAHLWSQVVARAKQLYLQDHDSLPDHVKKLLSEFD